jgi:hypothetical protein
LTPRRFVRGTGSSFQRDVVLQLTYLAFGEATGTSMKTGAIERLTGAKGALDEKESLFKVSVPRKELVVVIADVKMSPAMGLTS